jgi:ATP-binding cassette, subfamily B, bacterial
MPVYRYLWQLIRFRPRYYATDLSWATVHMALATVEGLILKAFFDHLTGHGGLALRPVIGLQVLYTALAMLSLYLAVMGYVNVTQHGMALVVRNMLARILQLPAARALPLDEKGERMSTGKAISTMRDDAQEMTEALIIIDDTVALAVTAAISFTIMVRIDPWVTVGTFAPLFLVIFVAQRLGRRARHYRTISRQATSAVTGMIADMFNNTLAVKVANAEERIVARFREANDRRREAMVRDRLMTQLVDSLSGGTVSVGVGLILLVAAGAMRAGTFTVGDFALFVTYIWPSTHLMRTAGRLITRYKQVGVSTQRMEEMMQGLPPGAVVEHNPIYMEGFVPRISALEKREEHHLEELAVSGLTYLHEAGNERSGIVDVDLTVPRGSFTVIAGRIGSGKSTLLKVLLGLLPAQAGQIYWNGRPVRDPTTFMRPPRAAYAGQVARLFSDTVRKNVLLGLPVDNVNLERAIATAVLEQDLAGMDLGLDTVVGPRGVRLSGGQAQRVAAARLFVREPELLVFDDLSSALDVETERQLWSRVLAQHDGQARTCLVVSHRPAALQAAGQIVVLKHGRVIDRGRLDELLIRCAEMRRLMDARTWTQ